MSCANVTDCTRQFKCLLVMIPIVFTFFYAFIFISKGFQEKIENFSVVRDRRTTVVTGYFVLTKFQKGNKPLYFSSDLYKRWCSTFSLLLNPLIVYLERNSSFVEIFKKILSKHEPSRYKIIEVERKDLWAFKLLPNITKIFSKPGYPKHPPNTVVPEYSAVMHCKYELMNRSIVENPFKTNYFAWLDIGLFRDFAVSDDPYYFVKLINETLFSQKFYLDVPDNFDRSKVAYTEVYDLSKNMKPCDIVNENMVWVCGCYFVGGGEVLLRWCGEYMRAVEEMIGQHDCVSTDQQVIYWLFSNRKNLKVSTSIQTYTNMSSNVDPWFYLGYLSRRKYKT
ncbi:hypothetical protein HELRODRAFT_181058 [Helobdella robusta]|uniref:Uncharacterized protein n=1 Tax=Helobdella robusta TaxID=6412 RepID=T1FGK3_HELRO|nr:hypothetical protein HELRODRAFT_181058 [Helobdella robusta]ESN93309.1 hypothetical protein HELRODRAFT_181058 [Helobdella robusta]